MDDSKVSAVKIFNCLFEESRPETMPSKKRNRTADPLDRALAKTLGIMNTPCDMTPRLVKRPHQPRQP